MEPVWEPGLKSMMSAVNGHIGIHRRKRSTGMQCEMIFTAQCIMLMLLIYIAQPQYRLCYDI